jgi:glutathione S-transferase
VAIHREERDRVLWARPRAGVDSDQIVFDSWTIANYLEDRYPDRPSLFRGDGGRAVTRFVNAWADVALVGGVLRLIVTDILTHLNEKDRAYFRETREKRLGATLEAVRNKCGRPWSRFAPYSQHSPTSEAGRGFFPINGCAA